MNWIIPEIAIGNRAEALALAHTESHGFRAILCLDGTLNEDDFEQFGVEDLATFELIDGEGNDPKRFRRAVAVLRDMTRHSAPVFVHCQAGQSRSAAVVAAYLRTEWGYSPLGALEYVAARRETHVHPALVELLHATQIGGTS